MEKRKEGFYLAYDQDICIEKDLSTLLWCLFSGVSGYLLPAWRNGFI